MAVHEAQYRLVRLHRAHKNILLADHAPQRRQQFHQQRLPLVFAKRRVLLAAESLCPLVPALNIQGCLLDNIQAQLVTGLVVPGPVDQPVTTHHDAFHRRVGLCRLTHHQPQIKARTLPVHPAQLVTENLRRQRLPILRRGNGDNRIRMRVVHDCGRYERVQRRVDR